MSPLFAASPIMNGILAASIGLFAFAVLFGIRRQGTPLADWLTPRERTFRKARRLLRDGEWQQAFALAGNLRDPKKNSAAFEQRLLNFEGDCLYRGAERSLQLGGYAEALELMRGAGDRLGLPEAEFDNRIISLLLAELRRRITSDPAGDEVPRIANEVLRVSGRHPEASFWLGLHYLHTHEEGLARDALQDATAESGAVDAALYLGALLLRLDQPAEGWRWLGRAVQAAPDCPPLQWQCGEAILAGGGDPAVAVKSLERATGSEGFSKYLKTRNLMWGTLGARSWLAALVRRTPVACPLGFDRPDACLMAARRTLATALEKCDRQTDAASVYYQAFSAGDDSLAVRKGLGLSLARAGLFDDALGHLQAAKTKEDPPSPVTVAYLALCTARSRAATPAERSKHVRDALALLTALEVRGDVEWARLTRDLVAEAKEAGVPLTPAQKLEVARTFASVDARDAAAADAYDQLAATGGEIPLEVATAYVRAALENGVRGASDLDLFDRAFRDRDGLRRLFAAKKWDATAAERLYLERSVAARPGRYPEAPGALYSALAERMLWEEARKYAADDRPADARAIIELATALGPTRPMTLDRLAEIAYRAGDREQCLTYLNTWAEKYPHDARAPARRALVEFRDGRTDKALARLTEACGKASGAQRARLLCVAARLALAADKPDLASELFDQARLLTPQDPEPLTGLAALAWQRGDSDRLASLAPLFDRARNAEPFRALLASLAFALAGDEERSDAEFEVAATDSSLAPEAVYLRAVLLVWQDRDEEARNVLNGAMGCTGPIRDHVYGLRGQLAWRSGDYADAVAAWSQLPAERRLAWKLDALFPAATFLGAAARLDDGEAAQAVELLRLSRLAGFEHPRLEALESVARQRAAQSVAVASEGVEALHSLEGRLAAEGRLNENAAAWLARGYRRQGELPAARRVLDRVSEPNAHVWLQLGLLALAEGDTAAAEAAFSAAANRAPDSPAVAYNLAFTRLSLAKLDTTSADLERASALHPSVEAKRILAQLASLAPDGLRPELLAGISVQDEQRLIKRIQQCSRLETAAAMVEALAKARPDSSIARQALAEVQLLCVHGLINRGEPEMALTEGTSWPTAPGRALNNLLGVAAFLTGEHMKALAYFEAALPAAGDDARVEQNLALTAATLGDPVRAAVHWKRYLTSYAAHCPAPPGDTEYLFRLADSIRARMGEAPACAEAAA